MRKRKYTNLAIDIDSVFYRIEDRDLRLPSQQIIKTWFNTLKENYNIYLVSNKYSCHEVEKKLRKYKIHRIPKGIYCYKDNIGFRREVIEKLINLESNDKKLSSVLFVSGNPYFLAAISNLGLTTCYVKELNKKNQENTVGTFTVDKVNSISSIGMYQNTTIQPLSNEQTTTKNLNIKNYIYIIGSGYDLIPKTAFNSNAIFTKEYNDTDINDTLAVSDDQLELLVYKRSRIATLFINNGYNDTVDLKTTYEKKIKI